MGFKELPNYLKPREKAIIYGVKKLNDIELLAIFLRTGIKNMDVLEVSKKIFEKNKSFKMLSRLSFHELKKINSIGKTKAIELKALFEIANRINSYNLTKIRNINDAIKVVSLNIENWKQENLILILINKNDDLIYVETIYKSSENGISVDPKDIISTVLKKDVDQFYCFHNHPSNNPTPSTDDIIFNKRLINICSLMNIKLIANVVLVENKKYCLIN